MENTSRFADSKPHYPLLDGLRGVAALLVVWYHLFEGFAFAGGGVIQTVNHGYLAVDFFFLLSGFVLSYAYDERWGKMLSLGGFFKRRLIRLHPMVLFGAVVGLVAYLIQGGEQWGGDKMPLSAVMTALLLAMCLLPMPAGAGCDVRGNGEMFPLNGPTWSLFFEYIGNLLYALFIRRLSTRMLALWTLLLGVGWGYFALADVAGYGMIGVGWTLDWANGVGGLLRMLFPFSLGMLLARRFRPVKIKGAFWLCTLVLVALFHVPYIAGLEPFSRNGLFEMLCVAGFFPLLLWLGASGTTTDRFSTGLCNFLGEISYPLYMVHYPLMYLFYAWLIGQKRYTLAESWPLALGVMACSVALAWLALKGYDEPLRRWLSRKFLPKSAQKR